MDVKIKGCCISSNRNRYSLSARLSRRKNLVSLVRGENEARMVPVLSCLLMWAKEAYC